MSGSGGSKGTKEETRSESTRIYVVDLKKSNS